MKISNVSAHDQNRISQGKVGLRHGSKLDEWVWEAYEERGDDFLSEGIELLASTLNSSGGSQPVEYATIDILEGAERAIAATQRTNQNYFRNCLLENYRKRCCITGLSIPDLLVASHIKPWKKCDPKTERLAPSNGLLLNNLHDKDDLALETAGNSFRRGTEVLLRGLIEASGFQLQEVNLWNDIAEDRTPSKLIDNPDYHSCELFLNSLGLIEETESDNIETIRKFGNPASHGQERASDLIQDENMQKMIFAANEFYAYANDYENHADDLREKAVSARQKVFSGILKGSFQTTRLEKQIFRYERKDNPSERDKKSLQRLRKKTELMNELQARYYRRLKKESPKKARSVAVTATTKSMNELLDEFDNTVSYASRKKDGIENKQQYLSRNFLDTKARNQLKEIEKDLSGAEAQLDAIASSIMAKLDKLDSLAEEGAAWELRTEASKHAAKVGYRQYNFGGEPLSRFWLFKQWYSRLSGMEQAAFVLFAFCTAQFLLAIPLALINQ